ncbi:MAG: LysR family transcriptional regulator [Polyangiaceae bacterium]
MLPSIESLRCFAAAAKLLSFRAAAKSVALTPAAFGQRIKLLEQQLGAPLFHRTTRSVRLTDEGIALLPAAERCLFAAAECVRVGSLGGKAVDPVDVVLGTRHELGLSWILPQLETLEKALPWARVHLYFGSGSDILLRVRTMEIDCAVTSTRLNDPKLDALRLHEESYLFVGATKLLRERPLTRPEHASRHTLLDADATLPLFRYYRDAPGGSDALRFASVVRLGTIEAIKRRMLAGGGVAVLPTYLIAPDVARGKLTVLFPKVKLPSDYFRLVFRVDDPRRAAYEGIAATLVQRPLE